MSKLLQLRGGTTAEHTSFTGAVREVTVDTDKDTLVVHDGTTAGGHVLPRTKADIDALNINADTLDGKQLATIESEYQAFANTAAANVVDSAPATLDTLNELAAALGDDPNFATTVSNSIGTKLNASAYTAADVLTKIKTVDGSGSGLDADTVDGIQGSSIVQTSDSRLTNSRTCNNSFDNATSARTNLGLGTGNTPSFVGVTAASNGHFTANTSNSGKYVRLYGSAGTGRWDIYGHGNNLRLGNNDNTGYMVCDRDIYAPNFNTTSDQTLKTNVETLTGSLDAVKSLRGVSFDWIENGNSEVGVIAQEVEAVLPDVVSTNDQGIKSVKYGNMVALLIEAMKEQQAQIDELKEQLNS